MQYIVICPQKALQIHTLPVTHRKPSARLDLAISPGARVPGVAGAPVDAGAIGAAAVGFGVDDGAGAVADAAPTDPVAAAWLRGAWVGVGGWGTGVGWCKTARKQWVHYSSPLIWGLAAVTRRCTWCPRMLLSIFQFGRVGLDRPDASRGGGLEFQSRGISGSWMTTILQTTAMSRKAKKRLDRRRGATRLTTGSTSSRPGSSAAGGRKAREGAERRRWLPVPGGWREVGL